MAYGFLLIYLRDFAPGKEAWIAASATGPHFEAKLAHVHGNLLAFLNLVMGYLLMRLPYPTKQARTISVLALLGLLMPIGILMEVLWHFPPLFVVIGALSMTLSVAWLGILTLSQAKNSEFSKNHS
ncbi:hypothetical protein COW36_19220 [bacterium (Candidatus Blackallbacteria) CG17_big_fil_post_rev_8_21_14_2_50_48_46]|uniref:Uncharacterized protein n=1 Tax=bacterium (Candidatus Blackallbacteria) CG17_big_fil_post_rev_8_21_14_2_50_48_46 TaxID=2014261 RepID=A0A2M7G0E6_9BACT|nr:MAG: hypothetical protein COW64_25250 [bacterium (Candidatus Blackallbacteria) CG18_big_fil_WC_8_21_14_2_50_49_26]PIW15107.1 MAG: hypothetical protein COW36_19220 [bacterium (Candidatus Blackallbacteria) CG17_big_fil_post_rev_8_21_14_2_50_48_46]PIW47659.1 MAG: hypothetical protein COW20_12100 [bacterium (Candidatus Blackallbacteria) CG13_big_fil_rev_8_21_14_2_50_49_14]